MMWTPEVISLPVMSYCAIKQTWRGNSGFLLFYNLGLSFCCFGIISSLSNKNIELRKLNTAGHHPHAKQVNLSTFSIILLICGAISNQQFALLFLMRGKRSLGSQTSGEYKFSLFWRIDGLVKIARRRRRRGSGRAVTLYKTPSPPETPTLWLLDRPALDWNSSWRLLSLIHCKNKYQCGSWAPCFCRAEQKCTFISICICEWAHAGIIPELDWYLVATAL